MSIFNFVSLSVPCPQFLQLPGGEPLLLVLSVVPSFQWGQQHHGPIRELRRSLQHAGILPHSLSYTQTFNLRSLAKQPNRGSLSRRLSLHSKRLPSCSLQSSLKILLIHPAAVLALFSPHLWLRLSPCCSLFARSFVLPSKLLWLYQIKTTVPAVVRPGSLRESSNNLNWIKPIQKPADNCWQAAPCTWQTWSHRM